MLRSRATPQGHRLAQLELLTEPGAHAKFVGAVLYLTGFIMAKFMCSLEPLTYSMTVSLTPVSGFPSFRSPHGVGVQPRCQTTWLPSRTKSLLMPRFTRKKASRHQEGDIFKHTHHRDPPGALHSHNVSHIAAHVHTCCAVMFPACQSEHRAPAAGA